MKEEEERRRKRGGEREEEEGGAVGIRKELKMRRENKGREEKGGEGRKEEERGRRSKEEVEQEENESLSCTLTHPHLLQLKWLGWTTWNLYTMWSPSIGRLGNGNGTSQTRITNFGTRLPYLHFWQNFFDPPRVKNAAGQSKCYPIYRNRTPLDRNYILTRHTHAQ